MFPLFVKPYFNKTLGCYYENFRIKVLHYENIRITFVTKLFVDKYGTAKTNRK